MVFLMLSASLYAGTMTERYGAEEQYRSERDGLGCEALI